MCFTAILSVPIRKAVSRCKCQYMNVQKGGADKILDQNKINNRRRSRICIPTKKGLKP